MSFVDGFFEAFDLNEEHYAGSECGESVANRQAPPHA